MHFKGRERTEGVEEYNRSVLESLKRLSIGVGYKTDIADSSEKDLALILLILVTLVTYEQTVVIW